MQIDSGYSPSAKIFGRQIERVARQRMADEPVLALHGPRAVGKTTLLLSIAAAHGTDVIDLDDLATREAVTTDPATFVSGPAPVCIDEYQHVPIVLDAIKAELNKDGSAGRFVITGSTRHDSLPLTAQALTGRLHPMTIYPLSQIELAGGDANLLPTLFDAPRSVVSARPSETSRSEYATRVATGGFPPPHCAAPRTPREAAGSTTTSGSAWNATSRSSPGSSRRRHCPSCSPA